MMKPEEEDDMSDELMAEHRAILPDYEGEPEAPLCKDPGADGPVLRKYEDLEREFFERFPGWEWIK